MLKGVQAVLVNQMIIYLHFRYATSVDQ